MERFKNAIFKQREDINDRMTEMFELLKELTTSRTPKKVLIREKAKSPVTNNINSISRARGEEERNDNDDMSVNGGINGTNTEMPVKKAEKGTEAEKGTKNKPIKRAEREETAEASSSQPVGKFLIKNKEEFFTVPGDGVGIKTQRRRVSSNLKIRKFSKSRPKSKNAKVRVNPEESTVKPEPELKNTIGCNLNPSDAGLLVRIVNSSMRGDGVAGIKRRRRDLSDGIKDLTTASGRGPDLKRI
ncbi:hypothetical protein Tco_0092012 [Tanacetum coccineum]